MNDLLGLIKKFFALQGEYAPCGMFTPTHIIATAICFVLIAASVILCAKRTDSKRFTLLLRISAAAIVILESIKISYVFITGEPGNLNSWLPLYFCSTYIFALIFAGFFKGFVKKCGLAFIGGAGIIGGLGFLLIPSTSLSGYPVWHFLSLYSLLFHSMMVFTGILTVIVYFRDADVRKWLYYAAFCAVFMTAALIVNSAFGCNMMFLKEPYNMPIGFIVTMHKANQVVYTVFMAAVYLAVPSAVLAVVNTVKAVKSIRKKREVTQC